MLVDSPVIAESSRAESVLVLEAASGGWKEGEQALVAELLTSGYELRVRAAHADSLDELGRVLSLAVKESGVTVGVAIVRAEDHATAWLCRPSSCEQIQVTMGEGELSRSRLALAVVERLRPIDLPTAPPPAPPEPDVKPSPTRASSPRPAPANPVPPRVWLNVGGMSSGASSPLPWLGVSLGVTLSGPWGLEGGLSGSPLAATTETRAGSLTLRAAQAVAFATFEPFSRRRVGLNFGLGGGTVHVRETASPAPGFNGFSRSATIALVSARARLQYQGGPLFWGLTIEPGVLVPPLEVEAGTETLLRLGRPWLALQASLGFAL